MNGRTWAYVGGVAVLVVAGVWIFAGGGDGAEAGSAPVAETPGGGSAAAPVDAGGDAPVRVVTDGPDAPAGESPTEPGGGGGGAAPAGDGDAAGSRGSTPAAGGSDAEEPRGTDPQAPSVARLLEATSSAYESLGSFRAEFEQELENRLLGRTTRSSGTLYQRQPDRFLMDFSDPEGDVIVGDGRHFWMYFPSVDAKQVLRTAGGAGGLDLHAQFIGDPVARFEATYEGREGVRGRPAHVITLVPREPAGYRRLKVWIDEEDHLVRRFVLTEENENVRHFELRDLEIDPALPDGLFEFTPPADAVVVDRG